MYDLPAADKAAFEAAVSSEERLMYCLPYNIYQDKFVDGYLAFTNTTIYKLLNGEIIATFPILRSANFHNEVMFGSCGFYLNVGALDDPNHTDENVGGHQVLVCQYISNKNLPRYSVIARACELLAENNGDGDPITNDSNERFCPNCNHPYAPNTQICPFCMDKKGIYVKLWNMTRGFRLLLCVPLIIAGISMILSFINPQIQANVINQYLFPPEGTVRGPISGFLLYVALIIGIDIFSRVLSVVNSRCSAVASIKFTLMLQTILYEKIQSLSLSSIQRRTTGDLMNRVQGDTSVIQGFLLSQLPSIFTQVVSFIIGFIIVIIINPLICAFIFVPVPLMVFIISKLWAFMRSRSVRLWCLNTRAAYLLHDIISGIRVVKCFGQEEKEVQRYVDANKRAYDYSIDVTVGNFFIIRLVSFGMQIGIYALMLYGYLLVFKNEMPLGTYHQLTTYANFIYAPLLSITSTPEVIINFLTSSSKVFEILEETPDVDDIALPIDIRIEGDISIRDMTFGYQDYNPVLKDFNAEIKAGEMIGIVGHSGCGKSTLINLIMRLYDVNRGGIYIDDVNIKDISQNSLRGQMGIVLQETFLFQGTIRDNIRYAKPYATDEEVIAAARTANAHDFIMNLPEGYNTMVGQSGMSLSGGERQRIAIARAVIHNPRILILDEATAALDTETEKLIQDAINKLTEGRTTLAIAHRLSTLRNADRLLVIDKGRVAEFGTHSELLELKGIYYKLVMAQRKMAKETAK